VRVKSYNEAVRLARCAGEDAANRRMRKAGRKSWSAADHGHGVRVTEGILVDLGFDVAGWTAIAGLRRNEPDEPKAKKKPRRRANAAPVQLSFTFA
jgi:hypothetical protein